MEELTEVPEEILQDITRKTGVEALENMETLGGRRINHVLAATTEEGEEVVLRIPKDPERPGGFEGEVWALEQAKEAGVPVPEVLAAECRGKNLFLMEKRLIRLYRQS